MSSNYLVGVHGLLWLKPRVNVQATPDTTTRWCSLFTLTTNDPGGLPLLNTRYKTTPGQSTKYSHIYLVPSLVKVSVALAGTYVTWFIETRPGAPNEGQGYYFATRGGSWSVQCNIWWLWLRAVRNIGNCHDAVINNRRTVLSFRLVRVMGCRGMHSCDTWYRHSGDW